MKSVLNAKDNPAVVPESQQRADTSQAMADKTIKEMQANYSTATPTTDTPTYGTADTTMVLDAVTKKKGALSTKLGIN